MGRPSIVSPVELDGDVLYSWVVVGDIQIRLSLGTVEDSFYLGEGSGHDGIAVLGLYVALALVMVMHQFQGSTLYHRSVSEGRRKRSEFSGSAS